MADKQKHHHFFVDKNTGLGSNFHEQLSGVISQLPDQVKNIQEAFYQTDSLLGKRWPLAEVQLKGCLDREDPIDLLKNVVEVFESVLSNAMDDYLKPPLPKRAMSLDDLIYKINNDAPPNYLKDIALALKSLYDTYPDPHHKIFTQKEKLLPFVDRIEPYPSYQKKLS